MNRDLSRVPGELKALRQWVVWKSIVRAGRPTKAPFRPAGGAAKSNAPSTWSGYAEAEAAAGGFDGAGFVFSPDDPFCGVDFDGCLEGGEVAEWARPWLDRLAGSYMEVSPSGNGVKVWCRASLPGPGGSRKLPGDHVGVETYDRGRFFAVTGLAFGEAPAAVADRQDVVDDLYRWIKDRPRKAPAAAPPPVGPTIPFRASAGRDDRIRRARLYLQKAPPAIQGQGGSDAAMWACGVAAVGFDLDDDAALEALRDWNAGCDPPWLEEGSQGLRRKVDEARRKTRNPVGWLLAETTDAGRAGEVGGARAARTSPPGRSLDARLAKAMRTDVGNGERLAARAGGSIRYCPAWEKWLVWDGRRFALDRTKAVHRLAKKAARLIFAEASTIEDDGERKRHVEHAIASQGKARLDAMLSMASSEPEVPIVPDQMDRDVWLFNCLNGTIDLRTGRLRPHDRRDMLTQLCPVEFDHDATCPLWLETLELFFAGDRDLIAFWRRLCGYALVGQVRDHVMPVAYGDGSNGKSTILGTLMEVFGPDYAMKAPSSMLMAKAHDAHPTDKAGMFRKRLVVAIETAEGRRLDEVMVKELTGGDRISARRMREDFWEFDPTHTLIMATNHKPTIRGTDHGIWRRLKLVPFGVKMDDDRADKSMPEKLRAEFPGILAWCVRGCLEWQAEGLGEPDCIKTATDDYRKEQDVLGQFLEDRTISNPSVRSKCLEIYNAYKAWADDAGERPVSLRAFGDAMKERGVGVVKSGCKWYVGIGLRPTYDEVAWGRTDGPMGQLGQSGTVLPVQQPNNARDEPNAVELSQTVPTVPLAVVVDRKAARESFVVGEPSAPPPPGWEVLEL